MPFFAFSLPAGWNAGTMGRGQAACGRLHYFLTTLPFLPVLSVGGVNSLLH